MFHRPRRVAVVLAAILALSAAGTASAASISESVSVNSVFTVTGIPASINYGAVDPGQATSWQSFTASVSTNASWAFRMSGSDFTGPGTIGKAARVGRVTSPTGSTDPTTTPANFFGFDAAAFNGTTVNAQGGPGSGGFTVTLYVDLADYAGAPAGSYSGTITYEFSAN